MHPAEKLAERDPPPEIAMPTKYPEALRRLGRVVGECAASVVEARVWLRARDSRGTFCGLSETFLLVQAERTSRAKSRAWRMGGDCSGAHLAWESRSK